MGNLSPQCPKCGKVLICTNLDRLSGILYLNKVIGKMFPWPEEMFRSYKHWKCDKCYQFKTIDSYHCQNCKWDQCLVCTPPYEGRCGNQHETKLRKIDSNYYCSRCANTINPNNKQNVFALSCVICNYDVCLDCAKHNKGKLWQCHGTAS